MAKLMTRPGGVRLAIQLLWGASALFVVFSGVRDGIKGAFGAAALVLFVFLIVTGVRILRRVNFLELLKKVAITDNKTLDSFELVLRAVIPIVCFVVFWAMLLWTFFFKGA